MSGLVFAITLAACSKSEPPPRFAPPTPERVEDAQAVEAPDGLDEDAVPNPAPPAPTPAPAAPEADAPIAVAASADAPKVDEELCRSACENALSVTLAELPESAIASMRDELTRALRDDCPARCVAKASLESARCIASAKTALALASCP